MDVLSKIKNAIFQSEQIEKAKRDDLAALRTMVLDHIKSIDEQIRGINAHIEMLHDRIRSVAERMREYRNHRVADKESLQCEIAQVKIAVTALYKKIESAKQPSKQRVRKEKK